MSNYLCSLFKICIKSLLHDNHEGKIIDISDRIITYQDKKFNDEIIKTLN